MDKPAFGRVLRALRSDLGLSQLALANTLETTQRHVSFLENGKSQPTKAMLGRIATGLSLSIGQRAALFDASGYAHSYRREQLDSDTLAETLDILDKRLLRHWPFPGFVLDKNWNILRANKPAHMMLQGFGVNDPNDVSLLDVFLAPSFLERVLNWEELSMAFYFRMQSAAAHSPEFARRFEAAQQSGLFDHIPARLTSPAQGSALTPAIFTGPGGIKLSMTSVLGRLATINDTVIDGLEVELMLPMDEETDTCLNAAFAAQ